MAIPSTESEFVNELLRLLASADAQARINPARVARSTLYDPQYHVAIVACSMRVHGTGSRHRILAPWLKLLQFVAARPALVDRFVKYAEKRRAGDIDLWQQMPRGYLGDETHEGVIDLLVASGILQKSGDTIEAASRYVVLDDLAKRIESDDLFAGEREIIDHLRSVRITKVLLGAS